MPGIIHRAEYYIFAIIILFTACEPQEVRESRDALEQSQRQLNSIFRTFYDNLERESNVTQENISDFYDEYITKIENHRINLQDASIAERHRDLRSKQDSILTLSTKFFNARKSVTDYAFSVWTDAYFIFDTLNDIDREIESSNPDIDRIMRLIRSTTSYAQRLQINANREDNMTYRYETVSDLYERLKSTSYNYNSKLSQYNIQDTLVFHEGLSNSMKRLTEIKEDVNPDSTINQIEERLQAMLIQIQG
jgi:hypothetical protein